MRGGRSLNELDRMAAAQQARTAALTAASTDEDDGGGGQKQLEGAGLAFLAVSVDLFPHEARRVGPAHWPHLGHYWIDAQAIAALDIAFVPNRVVADGRATPTGSQNGLEATNHAGTAGDKKTAAKGGGGSGGGAGGDMRIGRVLRWWDGTAGNVLKGPHGASRKNGSHALLDELRKLL